MHKSTALMMAYKMLLLSAFLGTVSLIAMNSQLSIPERRKPTGSCTIFNFQEELEREGNTKDVFSVRLLVTPDQKGVLIGRHGKVHFMSIENELNPSVEKLIEHAQFLNSPMMATAHRKDGSLLVCSAGNYSDQLNQKYYGEYILWRDKKISDPQKIHSPLQAIALDKEGKTIALAEASCITCIDVDTHASANYIIFSKNKSDRVLSIDINANYLVVAMLNGDIHLMQMSHFNGELSPLKKIKAVGDIKQIYYPGESEIVYKTKQHEIKNIDMYAFLDSQEGQELSCLSFGKDYYDKIFFDKENETAVCIWTKKSNNVDCKRNEIIIKKRRKDEMTLKSTFDLIESRYEVPLLLDQKYFYRKKGRITSGLGHLCYVALCKNVLAALGTDGTLYWWVIPFVSSLIDARIGNANKNNIDIVLPEEKVSIPKPSHKKYGFIPSLTRSDETGEKKGSLSSPRVRDKKTTKTDSGTDDEESSSDMAKKSPKKKKPSPRILISLRNSGEHQTNDDENSSNNDSGKSPKRKKPSPRVQTLELPDSSESSTTSSSTPRARAKSLSLDQTFKSKLGIKPNKRNGLFDSNEGDESSSIPEIREKYKALLNIPQSTITIDYEQSIHNQDQDNT
jgi:hypothetical protein